MSQNTARTSASRAVSYRLSDFYDADLRAKDPAAMQFAAEQMIPHPLNNVQYADGISQCRHAKRHKQHQACRQEPHLTPGAAPMGRRPFPRDESLEEAGAA